MKKIVFYTCFVLCATLFIGCSIESDQPSRTPLTPKPASAQTVAPSTTSGPIATHSETSATPLPSLSPSVLPSPSPTKTPTASQSAHPTETVIPTSVPNLIPSESLSPTPSLELPKNSPLPTTMPELIP